MHTGTPIPLYRKANWLIELFIIVQQQFNIFNSWVFYDICFSQIFFKR